MKFRFLDIALRKVNSAGRLGGNVKNPYHILAWALNAAAVGLAVAGMAIPSPWVRGLCAAVPWVAVAVIFLSGGRMVVSGQRRESRPDIYFAVCLSTISVAVLGVFEYAILDWHAALIAGAGVSVALTFTFAVALRWRLRGVFIVIVPIFLTAVGTPYGYGVICLADTAYDTAVVGTYTPQVLGKHVTRGRPPHTYYLTLAPWGPRDRLDTSVDRKVYGPAAIGDRVCVKLHPGHIGIRWYQVAACPNPSGNSNVE